MRERKFLYVVLASEDWRSRPVRGAGSMVGMTALRDLLTNAALEELGRQYGATVLPEEDPLAPGQVGPMVFLDLEELDLGALVAAIGRAALLDAADTVDQLRVGAGRFPAAPETIAAAIVRDAAALTD